MGFFKNLTRTVNNTLATAVSVPADLLTLGGNLTDRDESYTISNSRKLLESLEDLVENDDDDY